MIKKQYKQRRKGKHYYFNRHVLMKESGIWYKFSDCENPKLLIQAVLKAIEIQPYWPYWSIELNEDYTKYRKVDLHFNVYDFGIYS